jgi:hypothetical protein
MRYATEHAATRDLALEEQVIIKALKILRRRIKQRDVFSMADVIKVPAPAGVESPVTRAHYQWRKPGRSKQHGGRRAAMRAHPSFFCSKRFDEATFLQWSSGA